MSTVVVDRKVDPSGRVESETHTATINFYRLLDKKSLDRVIDLNGLDNLQVIFVNTLEGTMTPMAYFTFKGKPEFYVAEQIALPAQKSLSDSAMESVTEKYNAIQQTLTGALNSTPVEEVKDKVSSAIQWGVDLLKKK